MPDRRLSDIEQAALRKEVREKVAAGNPPSAILQELSNKYGVHGRSLVEYFEGPIIGVFKEVDGPTDDSKEMESPRPDGIRSSIAISGGAATSSSEARPIPCRHDCGGRISFILVQGSHSLECPGCKERTRIEAALKGEHWVIRTSPEGAGTAGPELAFPPSTGKIGRPEERENGMPKAKLSQQQKATLRNEILQMKAKGRRRSDFRSLAEKYKISKEAVRWHWKAVLGSTKGAQPATKTVKVPARAVQTRKSKGTPPRTRGAVSARIHAGTAENSAPALLVQARKFAERAALAGQLTARLESKLKHRSEVERRTAAKLRGIDADVHRIENQLSKVVKT